MRLCVESYLGEIPSFLGEWTSHFSFLSEIDILITRTNIPLRIFDAIRSTHNHRVSTP